MGESTEDLPTPDFWGHVRAELTACGGLDRKGEISTKKIESWSENHQRDDERHVRLPDSTIRTWITAGKPPTEQDQMFTLLAYMNSLRPKETRAPGLQYDPQWWDRWHTAWDAIKGGSSGTSKEPADGSDGSAPGERVPDEPPTDKSAADDPSADPSTPTARAPMSRKAGRATRWAVVTLLVLLGAAVGGGGGLVSSLMRSRSDPPSTTSRSPRTQPTSPAATISPAGTEQPRTRQTASGSPLAAPVSSHPTASRSPAPIARCNRYRITAKTLGFRDLSHDFTSKFIYKDEKVTVGHRDTPSGDTGLWWVTTDPNPRLGVRSGWVQPDPRFWEMVC